MNSSFCIKTKKFLLYFSLGIWCMLMCANAFCQTTSIRGFVEARTALENGEVSFGLGEQDLFITSELSDRFSFLGESVFRYDESSHTKFSVSVERVVMKYNIAGNHNILIGKHHTPLNYWNDTYHHGRLFFPTIDRPLTFSAEIIPLHTTGISFQGHNLGKIKFGYDMMIGNGLGSSEINDNDKHKSWSAAVHIKPVEKLRIGASYYYDIISKGAHLHDKLITRKINQHLFSGSVAYFGKKLEVLAEGTAATNKNDSTGNKHAVAAYLYGGYKITEKLISYFRLDNLHFQNGDLFFTKNNSRLYLLGMRFQINYLAVIKLEFQHLHTELEKTRNSLTVQAAIGF